MTLVDSVAATTVAGFSARADLGSTGVAYVWYVAPGIDRARSGPAGPISLSGPGWQYVDAAAATYTWRLLDAATARLVESRRQRDHRRLHGGERRRPRLPAGRAGV